MIPKLDLPQPSAADPTCAPLTQNTIVPAKRSLYDLYTGGWRRHLTGLPTALKETLARWAGHDRSTAADRRDEPSQDATHQ